MATFLKINSNSQCLGMLLAEICKTCSTNRKHKTGRLKHARTAENADNNCGWNGRLTKCRRPKTNTSFNPPDREN